jgi:putative spermidine/putrescine transport system permease protein
MRTRSIDANGLLIVPSLIVLLGIFAVPLVWFFVKTLAIDLAPGTLVAVVMGVLTSRAVQVALFYTIWNSLIVTVVSLVMGYPIAYYLANRSGMRLKIVIFCVVIPYFTSTIVRTYAWMVLLGNDGVVNRALVGLGFVRQPAQLLYNNGAVIVGMVYVMLPFVVLTLFAVMKRIDTNLLRAAEALGASPTYTFLKVYLPLTMSGVVSSALMVIILSIGFFITPALMGGPRDVMLGMLIQRSVEILLDWRSASVISLVLLAATLVLYAIYAKVTDIQRLLGASV